MITVDQPRVLVRVPVWALLLGVLTVVAALLAVVAAFGDDLLPDRTGPPIEELVVERSTLEAGTIEITVRNTGPDPVRLAQVFVNDTYVDFTGAEEPLGRLGSETLRLRFPWITGQPYTVSMLTSTGLVIEHTIPAAVATPKPGAGLFGLMALLGTYVGVIPVALGMLVLPILRRAGRGVVRVLLALTVGLLGFLAADAAFEGLAIAQRSGGAFGGARLVLLGAALAFLALTAVDRLLDRRRRSQHEATSGRRPALMIAIGIGLHNLGEGLAIGSAYAVGELAVGAALVVGFAVHNTTEGLAIVAPLTGRRRPSVLSLVGLGLVAGAPAILGAVIGAAVDNAALSAALFGVGVGAITQVIIAISPGLRDRAGRLLDPAVIGGLAAGVAVMYLTGLLVTV